MGGVNAEDVLTLSTKINSEIYIKVACRVIQIKLL
jgi:hypothetical protein